MTKKKFDTDFVNPITVTPRQPVDPLDRAAQALKEHPLPFSVSPKAGALPVENQSQLSADSRNTDSGSSYGLAMGAQAAEPDAAVATAGEGDQAQYMEVPLDLIDDNPFNAREIYLPEKISERAADIKLRGQLVPGLAVLAAGRYRLIAGHYRKRALQLVGHKTMKLMVYSNVSEKNAYVLSYKENHETNPQTPLDNALRWRALLKEGVFGSELEIAESIGMSKSNVNKTMQILNLSSNALEIVEQAPEMFALSTLYELVLLDKVAGEKEAGLAAEHVLKEGWGRKDVADRRAEFERAVPRQRRRNETSRQYKITMGENQIGAIKEWDNGKVVLEVSSLEPNQRIKLVEDLKKMFSLDASGFAPVLPDTESPLG